MSGRSVVPPVTRLRALTFDNQGLQVYPTYRQSRDEGLTQSLQGYPPLLTASHLTDLCGQGLQGYPSYRQSREFDIFLRSLRKCQAGRFYIPSVTRKRASTPDNQGLQGYSAYRQSRDEREVYKVIPFTASHAIEVYKISPSTHGYAFEVYKVTPLTSDLPA